MGEIRDVATLMINSKDAAVVMALLRLVKICKELWRSPSLTCCGACSATFTLRNPVSLKEEHSMMAHYPSLEQMETEGNYPVTCGYSLELTGAPRTRPAGQGLCHLHTQALATCHFFLQSRPCLIPSSNFIHAPCYPETGKAEAVGKDAEKAAQQPIKLS
ncbi:uncharacterized protein VP01_3428g8 [Puccinia sorghi]|uniref:Uncharacterized protein n=1 Tax=Puccinia sorghi TaxID=27349 RepID=A0A0L6UWE6_9BASI|nr:uncharacterized protein VP01_3428g8 [Puccinia sorghi]